MKPNRLNVWRKPITNTASKKGAGYKIINRPYTNGYVWRIMVGDVCVKSGWKRTKRDAQSAATRAKRELTA